MGKKNKNKPEENLGEVTQAEVINASESAVYIQDKENKELNIEKPDLDEQDFKMEKSKLSSAKAVNQLEPEESKILCFNLVLNLGLQPFFVRK